MGGKRTVLSVVGYRPVPSRARRVLHSNSFAWGVSLGMHAVLFGAFWVAVLREQPTGRKVIIPEARLAAAPGPAVPSRAQDIRVRLEVPARIPSESPPKMEPLPLTALPIERPDWATTPGEPVSAGLTAEISGGVGRAAAPPARFFGQVGNAYKVVYVVDVSASLMIYIDQIVQQMRESIAALLPTQQFHIVLARPQRVDEFGPRRLVPAIRRYKKEAFAFLDTIERIPRPGKADPIEAMRRAFAVRPELIYFLSDGDYRDIEQDLERELRRLNAHGTVAITTIGFEPSPGPRALLERIAREHHGHFRVVHPQ